MRQRRAPSCVVSQVPEAKAWGESARRMPVFKRIPGSANWDNSVSLSGAEGELPGLTQTETHSRRAQLGA